MPDRNADNTTREKEQRWELLHQIDATTDKPLIALSFVWLLLLIIDLTSGLPPILQVLSTAIWIVFWLDFLLGIVIAPRKLDYLRSNWLTAVSLFLPALRLLRVFRVLRLLRAVRAVRSANLLRLLTSLNRGMRALGRTAGRRGLAFVIILTLIVTVTGAAGMAFFESPAAVEGGTGLAGYGEALWWTAMIMTTLGSEYWPRTLEGRILGWLLAFYALAIFGYIAGTFASYFVERESNRPMEPESEGAVSAADLAALRAEITALRAEVARLNTQSDVRPPPAMTRTDGRPDETAQ